ncbi:nucleotidyltransferase family protein [Ancylobacter dichloromethanicus]|uniref:Mannose-1-phosphate guanylyltransferase n=1 Tax=Ancylobacter dichloromethanicus TaxID=518825 RepID=A0A9W6JCI1_9HYPH|nr:nucleotidyltransferase family protein [Ancylobacter dichloromethanicus]MBS7552148.1 nucleotidyltransferase family protein [Ancylobacter dichloromethanicus]GLK73881.1 mannose-1-phosphate guanylyltransferase [Ancylobacter dichloromethanicus]
MTAITTAMVLAAGLGTRMRPLTDAIPKPMVEIGGRAMIDLALDRLADAGVETAVVNLHWHADVLERHLAGRTRPRLLLSDERAQLLETGGGIRKALPLLGPDPFFVVNADTLWIEGIRPNLSALAARFDPQAMDICLLLAPAVASIGYEGRGDFLMDGEGRLTPRPERLTVPFVYAGAAVVAPSIFADAPEGPFSLSRLFRRAAEAGRLFGQRMEGVWMHVGTPEAIAEAEEAIRRSKD